MSKEFQRRQLLKALAVLKVAPTPFLLKLLTHTHSAMAAGEKKYLVTVRPVFCLRDEKRTNFTGDLLPLSPYQNVLKVVTELDADGKGDEYHGGKQKRFATCCSPVKGTHTNAGGGAFDGASFDVVVGRHQKNVLKTKEEFLILGAFPNTRGQTTFEGFSFANKSQYVPPIFDVDKVMNDIKKSGKVCSGEKIKLDVSDLEHEKKILISLQKEYGNESSHHQNEAKQQLLAMQAKYSELIKSHEAIIKNGGLIEGDCLELDPNPLAHQFVGNWPLADVPQHYEPILRKMNHCAAAALASNYTASVTLNYNFSGHDQPNVVPYHGFTHASFVGRSQADGNKGLDQLCLFQINMLAHLLNELKALKILDQTVVIYTPHERPTHFHQDTPVIAHGFGTGFSKSGLKINDIAKDILNIFKVPNADNFGAETARGGILI